jgi:hypothetical protein
MSDGEVDNGELPHLDSGADELVGLDRFYNDGGAASTYIQLREDEKALAKRLSVPHLDGLNGYSGEVTGLMQRWFQYCHMAGGEHYGPVAEYAHQRILLIGDALKGRLPAERGLGKILAEEPQRIPLSADESTRYSEYTRGLNYR